MKIFGLVGWSGSGKTTLVTNLLPELIGRGLTVSTMKHTHHSVDIDKKGKDSYEHRVAGATEVLVAGSKRWALLHENRNAHEPSVEDLLARMEEVDLVLIEGFKLHNHDKIEVFRSEVGKPLLSADDPTIVAVASNDELKQVDLPVIDIDDIEAIADFIIVRSGLKDRVPNGAA